MPVAEREREHTFCSFEVRLFVALLLQLTRTQHKPESVVKNKTHKILWSFNEQEKRICHLEDFIAPANYVVKIKESEKMDEYLNLAGEIKKNTIKHEGDGDNNLYWIRFEQTLKARKKPKNWKSKN